MLIYALDYQGGRDVKARVNKVIGIVSERNRRYFYHAIEAFFEQYVTSKDKTGSTPPSPL